MPRGIYDRVDRRELKVIDHREDPNEGLTKEQLKDRIADLDKQLQGARAASEMHETEMQIAANDIKLLENRCSLYERLLDKWTQE